MNEAEAHYHSVGGSLEETTSSQMFGVPCYKVLGKPFASFYADSMVFKLRGDAHAKALALEGAQLFDPSKKGRAMKEWIQVPFTHEATWPEFAAQAYDYVKELHS